MNFLLLIIVVNFLVFFFKLNNFFGDLNSFFNLILLPINFESFKDDLLLIKLKLFEVFGIFLGGTLLFIFDFNNPTIFSKR